MSYQKPDTGNTMNDYFTRLGDFTCLAPNLLKARTCQNFEVWLDKLIQIDRRSLVLYLRKNKEQIPEEYWQRAKFRLRRWLKD